MIYLTGDTHGEFERIVEFCEHFHTVKSDVMIILGDAGINFSESSLIDLRKSCCSLCRLLYLQSMGIMRFDQPFFLGMLRRRGKAGWFIIKRTTLPCCLVKTGRFFN